MLNKAQVNALFTREAILLGSKDGVPMERVKELFGQEAVDKVSKFGKCGVHFNIFGCGASCQVTYFYLLGFQYAATYANISELANKKLRSSAGNVVEISAAKTTK